jgi:hypothetical protein
MLRTLAKIWLILVGTCVFSLIAYGLGTMAVHDPHTFIIMIIAIAIIFMSVLSAFILTD